MSKKNREWVDDPELTASDFARARPMKDVMPEVVEALKRGRPKLEHPKERVSLRLNPEIVAAYKATGAGWQGRINDVLASALRKQRKPKVA